MHKAADKVVAFILQFDATFTWCDDYMESTKMQMVEMHLTKTAREWWMNLKSQVLHPKTWKLCHFAIWNHFVSKEAKAGIFFAWRRLQPFEEESYKDFKQRKREVYCRSLIFLWLDFEGQQ